MGAVDPQPSSGIESGLRALLDHIAVELAHEYVRLMEEAAKEETQAPGDEEPADRGGAA